MYVFISEVITTNMTALQPLENFLDYFYWDIKPGEKGDCAQRKDRKKNKGINIKVPGSIVVALLENATVKNDEKYVF